MITLTTEQAQQIEEALVATLKNNDHWLEKCTGALDTIRAAITQEQAEQEPVAWYGKSKTGNILLSVNCVDEDWKPLYAASVKHVQQEPVGEVDIHMDFLRINWKDGRHPPKGTKLYTHPVRTKDLTDYEIDSINFIGRTRHQYARAVIAAHKEKNRV